MRGKRIYQVRAYSIFISLLMIFSLLTPGFVWAQKDGGNTISLNIAQDAFITKAKNDLPEKFKSDEMVTFLIRFKEKADVHAAAAKAKDKAGKAELSAYNQEIQQRSAVISELKATARNSQERVKEFLEEQVENGKATDLESFYIVNGMKITATKDVAEQIASFSEVMELYPSEKYQLVGNLERPLSKKTEFEDTLDLDKNVVQKETDNIFQSVEWNIERINAPDVWSMGFEGQGIVVANIDTGVQWDHPALKEKYAGYNPDTGEIDHTYSFFDPVNGQTVPYDNNGHGTHTMGTMVGSTPDGDNQIGVAPKAKWIAVQAFTSNGARDYDLLAAAEWILAPGGDVTKAPDVVNNSWGGGPGINEWYMEAVDAWREAQIVPVFAAGNTTSTNPGGARSVASPANYPQSFAVGNTDRNDMINSSSLRGPSPYGEIKPDVSAPGTGIRSAVPGSGYAAFTGTSMAAPAVAGVVALMKQANSSLDVDEIEQIIMDTATTRTDAEYPESPNNGYGYGIINALEAITTVAEDLGTLEGTVVMAGEDKEEPTYAHKAPEQALAENDLSLSIYVRDNVSVTDVTLHYGDTSIEAEKVSGNYKSGDFVVTIPGSAITGESFTYHWEIVDYGENTVTTDDYGVPVIQPLLFEGFETEPVDWQIVGTGTGESTWEWGVPTSGPNSAVRGSNVAATNLAGTYNSNEESYLDSPAISLPEGNAFLKFDQWYDFESGWDYGLVLATNDPAGKWTVLDELTGTNGSWETAVYDLSEFSGDDVYLSFSLLSDGNRVLEGWYIDNITVTDVPIAVGSNGNPTATTAEKVTPSNIPLDATISVLESGRSVKTNPMDGSFSMLHSEGTYTVVAEAYGFSSGEKTVDILADNSVSANFILEELPMGVVSGTITSGKTGDVIEGATIYLVEDANIEPALTDTEGNYDLTAYEGEYTLKVVAKNYHPKEISISVDGNITQDIQLEPFYTVPGGEIAYDDGTAENARAFYDAGNGWAVKMSLPEDVDKAIVTDGVFQFHGTDWPNPGDTPFAVEVWSANADGMPGEKLVGPIDAEAIRDLNKWTVVDLREHNIQVDGDFFMVYIQSQPNPNTPGLAIDANSGSQGRGFEYVGGAWNPSPQAEGNYMIRARIDVEVGNPVIDESLNNLVTNNSIVTVTGLASKETGLNLYNNGELAGTTSVNSEGEFSIDVALAEGDNKLKAVTLVDGEEATESEEVIIVLDTIAPVIKSLQPTSNLDVIPGDEVKVSFTSDTEGGTASFNIDMPGTLSDSSHPMNEVEPGVYEGTFVVPEVEIDGAEIVVDITDAAGNTSSQVAPGVINIILEKISRISGDIRYDTAIEVSMEGFESADTVIIARGLGFADALSGVPLAHKLDAPILLTKTNKLWNGILEEIDRLGATNVVVLGGTSAISEEVVSELENSDLDLNVRRIAGENRFETAALIANEMAPDGADKVVLANGMNFPDALSVAAHAAKAEMPILLTRADRLPNDTANALVDLEVSETLVVGGENVVQANVLSELPNPERVSGNDRYETNIALANHFGFRSSHLYVATGKNYVDALTGAALAAKLDNAVVLVSNNVPPSVVEFIQESGVKRATIFGGEAAVSSDVEDALRKLLQ